MNRISCILSSLPDDLGPTCSDFLQLSSIPFQVPQTLSELNQVIVAATDSKQKIRSDFFHPHQLFLLDLKGKNILMVIIFFFGLSSLGLSPLKSYQPSQHTHNLKKERCHTNCQGPF